MTPAEERAWRKYRIERAVWLYVRWCRAIDKGDRQKTRALGDRVLRALRHMPAEDQHQYYLKIANLRAARYTPERSEARAELSRQRGKKILDSLTAEEKVIYADPD